MTMDREVFLSLLALDSYNRGYGENLSGLPTSGLIGEAAILTDALGSLNQQDVLNAGFYAIAYDWSGETIISYRATDIEVEHGSPCATFVHEASNDTCPEDLSA